MDEKTAPKKRGRKPVLDPELVAAALAELQGNVAGAAKRFGRNDYETPPPVEVDIVRVERVERTGQGAGVGPGESGVQQSCGVPSTPVIWQDTHAVEVHMTIRSSFSTHEVQQFADLIDPGDDMFGDDGRQVRRGLALR